MSMIEIFRSLGKQDALILREQAHNLDGTQIIAREFSVPEFNPLKDYSNWPLGAPVADEGQVWTLLQPHNAGHYEGRPSTLRALWSLCHTKDPYKAKPWVDAYGTSGMYMANECYKDEEGNVWRCLNDNTVHTAAAYPAGWALVQL